MISPALLEQPLSITNPNIWTEHTANKVYEAWDGQTVSLYNNNNFDVEHIGLQINDKLGLYSSSKVRVDLHKQENTNGCIFIVDPSTPPTSDPITLSSFEPKFITDIIGKVGGKRHNIGTMHMIGIK